MRGGHGNSTLQRNHHGNHNPRLRDRRRDHLRSCFVTVFFFGFRISTFGFPTVSYPFLPQGLKLLESSDSQPDRSFNEMPAQITMPQLTDTMTEGTVVKWVKNEGDKVKMGEVVAEIETDKATMEMEAPKMAFWPRSMWPRAGSSGRHANRPAGAEAESAGTEETSGGS